MDEGRFDDLARAMAAGTPRRSVLKGMLAGLFGAATAAVAPATAEAAPPTPPCQHGKACTATGAKCCPGEKCVNGVCVSPCQNAKQCPGGATCCNGVCVPACGPPKSQLNPTTCACQCPPATCPTGQNQDPTTCQCVCPSGTKLCNGQCVNTATSAANCGRCGTVCPSGAACVGGTCTCPSGTALCSNGQCASSACPTGSTFDPATCQCVAQGCPTGSVLCGGHCVDYTCAGYQEFNLDTCQCGCGADRVACPGGAEAGLTGRSCCFTGNICVQGPSGPQCCPPGLTPCGCTVDASGDFTCSCQLGGCP